MLACRHRARGGLSFGRSNLFLLCREDLSHGLNLSCCIGLRNRSGLGGSTPSLNLRRPRSTTIAHQTRVSEDILVLRGDADIAHRRLKLNERMRPIVHVARNCFASRAEVRVMADGTLVAHTSDVRLLGLAAAQRTVTVDAEVANEWRCSIGYWCIDGSKSVTRMSGASILDAVLAEIPIGAIETLVAHAIDLLVTSITDGIVAHVAARSEQSLCSKGKYCLLSRWVKAVSGMMAMLVAGMAVNAKVKVLARVASDKITLGQHYYAAVAGTSWNRNARLLLGNVRSVNFLLERARDLWLDVFEKRLFVR